MRINDICRCKDLYLKDKTFQRLEKEEEIKEKQ